MENFTHPLINTNEIIDDMTIDQIHVKISEIYRRIAFANNMGHLDAARQLELILENYEQARQAILNKAAATADSHFDKIQVG